MYERIGDVKGKAATLAYLAYLVGEAGDRTQQLTLNLQAAEALNQARAYSDLLTVLSNLGIAAAENSTAYFAQAIWLMLRVQPPLSDAISVLNALCQRIKKGAPLEALLGATAFYFCQTRGEKPPDTEQLSNASLNMLAGTAIEQGTKIETIEDLTTWMQAQQLNRLAISCQLRSPW